jgi:hypothetical protein
MKPTSIACAEKSSRRSPALVGDAETSYPS